MVRGAYGLWGDAWLADSPRLRLVEAGAERRRLGQLQNGEPKSKIRALYEAIKIRRLKSATARENFEIAPRESQNAGWGDCGKSGTADGTSGGSFKCIKKGRIGVVPNLLITISVRFFGNYFHVTNNQEFGMYRAYDKRY